MKIASLVLMMMTMFVLVIGSVGCTTASPTVQSGPDVEVSFDGLHKVDNARVDAAWAVPDFDLSSYINILPVNVGVEYREVKDRSNTSRARAQFEALVDEIVMEELQKSNRFPIVDEPGPNTMIVSGGLLNVTSEVPPDPIGGRSRIYLSSVGDATLVPEIRDSESNRILARAVDRRAAETIGGSFQRSNTVSNSAKINRLIRHWAVALREGLEGFNP